MPKDTGIKELIVNELKNGELSYKKILGMAYDKTSTVSEKSAKKGVNKYLYEYLKDGTIIVVGYDLSLSRNIHADGIIFALTDWGPVYLTNLINSVLDNQIPNEDEDYTKLRAIFTKKIEEWDNQLIREWDETLENVGHRKLDFHEMLWLEVIKDLQSQISQKTEKSSKKLSFKIIKNYLKSNPDYYQNKIPQIKGKYKNRLLWYFKDEKPDILKVKSIQPFVNYHIFKAGQMTQEDYLIKTGIYKNKPTAQSEKMIIETFERTILYINSRPEEERNHLIYRLAYSLGPGNISTTRFRNLMEEIKEKSSTSYYDEVSDIIDRAIKKRGKY